MTYLRVKNWRKHQHYLNKENPPPWIKLKRAILTDYEVRALNEADRFKLIALWLLASDKDGTIPDDPAYVAGCIGVKRIDLDLFVSRGFLERVYKDSRVGLDALEVEVEEKRTGLKTPSSPVPIDLGRKSSPVAHAPDTNGHGKEPALLSFAAAAQAAQVARELKEAESA